MYVAENEEGNVIGYAQARHAAYQAYETELDSIHIDEPYRGQQIGKRLMAALAHHLYEEGFGSLMLWVIQENRARHFYERLGGIEFDEKPMDLGKQPTTEIAYGYPDITTLFE